jgi:hypothetical protein
MEMAARSMETAETAIETDGDGSGGTSPSRQGAGTETSVPQNLSSTTAELQNCSGKNADFLGFSVGRLHGEAGPWPLSGSRLVLVLRPGKIGVSELVSSNSENISCVAILKHKNSKKQGTGTVASC